MFRKLSIPRDNWKKTIESQGFLYHSVDNIPYWDESAYYEFDYKQVDVLEASTNELHKICLEAVQHVIDNKRYYELKIPNNAIELIENSWNNELPSIYGRFDLSYDGINAPKMLEYNSDTPTSLTEASIIQWYWLQDTNFAMDQFNSIHEKLIAKWKSLIPYLNEGPLYFTALDQLEYYMNLSYMRDCANQAGINTKEIKINDIGWDGSKFLDLENFDITNVFKLYPWEWLLNEEFGNNIIKDENCNWIEPAWKLILSNKGILPILWELNPGHHNLLPAYFNQNNLKEYVKKPFYSREGANITIHTINNEISTDGEYGEEGFIYQQFSPLPNFDGNFPVIGSWVIDGESAGIGIRESSGLITNNVSKFVPHLFR